MWSYTSTPPYAFVVYCLIVKHGDNFTFPPVKTAKLLLPSGIRTKILYAFVSSILIHVPYVTLTLI
jgi:hypothetical protein